MATRSSSTSASRGERVATDPMVLDEIDGFDMDVFERSPFDDPPEGVIDVTPAPGIVLRADPTAEPQTEHDRLDPSEDRDLPRALVYSSAKDGTGVGHVVIRQANGEWTCICWPGIRQLPKGCHAMQSARRLLGLPPVE